MRLVLCICAALTLVLPGCGEDSPTPQAPIPPGESAFDRAVRENCEAVEAAAKAYFAANGNYDWYYMRELEPFLPEGKRLVNPATGEATDPVGPTSDGILLDPWAPGSVGIRIFRTAEVEWRTYEAGYYIVGRGEECDIVLTSIQESELQADRDAAVVHNVKVVEIAAHAFAQDNDGVFATNNADLSNAGLTIQQYLPDSRLLVNPYTGWETEPQWGAAAAATGQTGYIAIDPNGDGVNDGFMVDGVGGTAGTTIIVRGFPPRNFPEGFPPDVFITPCPGTGSAPPLEMPFDEQVLTNCDLAGEAALAYFLDNGTYADRPYRLAPYLPGGALLINPSTGAYSEPSIAIPQAPGMVGYRVIHEYGAGPVGYYIEGMGEYDRFAVSNIPDIGRHLELEARVIQNCMLVAAAADEFARDNGWIYPMDNGTVNGLGLTVQDYLPGGLPLENPYTGSRSEPAWNTSVSLPGQTGYRASRRDYKSYWITGIGAEPGEQIFYVRNRWNRD